MGAAPFVRALADHIGLIDLLNRLLTWDPARTRIFPGERIFVLMVDLLLGKTPWYRVADRLQETDVPLLFGVGRQAADYSDDRLGRALDKLADANPKEVFTAVAAQAYTREQVHLQRLHWDSTSKSLYGAYPEAEAADPRTPASDASLPDVRQAPPAVPKRGYSKDHRPDLKPLIMSVWVNGDGAICLGSVDAGNASDKALNRRVLAELAEAFTPEALHDLVYVADSTLVTTPTWLPCARWAYRLYRVARASTAPWPLRGRPSAPSRSGGMPPTTARSSRRQRLGTSPIASSSTARPPGTSERSERSTARLQGREAS